jgi:hypothetical protein
MPRACPVESYVGSYSKPATDTTKKFHGLAVSRWLLNVSVRKVEADKKRCVRLPEDLRVRLLFGSCQRETPRGKPVASFAGIPGDRVAASVKLHGTSPWHLLLVFPEAG